jgi:hypothetical protein
MSTQQERKIEALLDSIAYLNGAFDNPESLAYRLKNPLCISSFSQPGKHDTNEFGVRIFTSHLAGYKAGLYDLAKKISGTSRAKISSSDSLSALLGIYGISEPTGRKKVLRFLRCALADDSITDSMTLTEFIQ